MVSQARKKSSSVDWESFGWDMVYRVGSALDRWCWDLSGDSALDCYAAHQDRSLYELAEEFVGEGFGITEEDVKLLEKMPKKYYKKFDAEIRRRIDKVVNKLMEEWGGGYGEGFGFG
jgi:hypothetical protein